VACAGAFLILTGIVLQILQLVVTIRNWRKLRDLTGDPWDGRTFEWSLPSPPPVYNFAVQPEVAGLDAYWELKSTWRDKPSAKPPAAAPAYAEIHLPTNSPAGVLVAFFAAVGGFAVVWHIWWLAAVGVIGGVGVLIASSWTEHEELRIPADTVADTERRLRAATHA